MLKFLADENFNNRLLRGLLRHHPKLDIVRVQDVGLIGQDDPTILAWAAQKIRVLLTHDARTVTKYAYKRVTAGLPMPGVFEVSREAAFRILIEDIWLLAVYSLENEWENRICYIPLKEK